MSAQRISQGRQRAILLTCCAIGLVVALIVTHAKGSSQAPGNQPHKLVDFGATLSDWDSDHAVLKQCGLHVPCAPHAAYVLSSTHGRSRASPTVGTVDVEANRIVAYLLEYQEPGIRLQDAVAEAHTQLPSDAQLMDQKVNQGCVVQLYQSATLARALGTPPISDPGGYVAVALFTDLNALSASTDLNGYLQDHIDAIGLSPGTKDQTLTPC